MAMNWFVVLLCLFSVSSVFAQSPEIVMSNADIEIRFSGSPDWINGGDPEQVFFSVDSILDSEEPLSQEVKHTTKLNEPETWESEMWRLVGEPFRKAVFVITIYQASNRVFELRVRNRYANEDIAGPWNLPTEDKVIGKPGKSGHK